MGKYWANIGKILGKYWANIGRKLGKYCQNIGRILGEYWANIGQILSKYWAILGKYWPASTQLELLQCTKAHALLIPHNYSCYTVPWRTSYPFHITGTVTLYRDPRTTDSSQLELLHCTLSRVLPFPHN